MFGLSIKILFVDHRSGKLMTTDVDHVYRSCRQRHVVYETDIVIARGTCLCAAERLASPAVNAHRLPLFHSRIQHSLSRRTSLLRRTSRNGYTPPTPSSISILGFVSHTSASCLEIAHHTSSSSLKPLLLPRFPIKHRMPLYTTITREYTGYSVLSCCPLIRWFEYAFPTMIVIFIP